MKKLLSVLAGVTLVASTSTTAMAFSPAQTKKESSLDQQGDIVFSGAKANWTAKGYHGGKGTYYTTTNSDGDIVADAGAHGGNSNNSYAHAVIKMDYSSYATSWDEFAKEYPTFTFSGTSSITGQYQRNGGAVNISNRLYNSGQSSSNSINTGSIKTQVESNAQTGFLTQTSVGGPQITTKGWNNWWTGFGKKKTAGSQEWGGSTAITMWHDDKDIYMNIAADFQNDNGTYGAKGDSTITINDFIFYKVNLQKYM